MRKFVIVKDSQGELTIRLSNCVECHFELVSKGYTCVGGGHFHLEDNNIYLYGTSIDYDTPSLEAIKTALENTLSSWSHFDYYYSDVLQCPVQLEFIKNSNLIKL
jgi:hypothetical protein